MPTYLALTVGTSRGRDTYGYNIVTLRDTTTGKRYRCMGGGYDMQGTVFAAWLQDTQQTALQTVKAQAHSAWTPGGTRSTNDAGLYGMSYRIDTGTVQLDGACGMSSMKRIAEAIGLSVQHDGTSRGRVVGFHVTSA